MLVTTSFKQSPGPQREPVNICSCSSCLIVLNVGQGGGSAWRSARVCLILGDEGVQWLQHPCLPPSPLHRSALSELKPRNRPASGPLPSDNRWPVSAGPPPQPSPSKCVDFYIWEPGKESSGPRQPSGHPEASERQPEGWLLFPQNLPHRRGAAAVSSRICCLMERFSCYRVDI